MSQSGYPTQFPAPGMNGPVAPDLTKGKKGKAPKEPKAPTQRSARKYLVGMLIAAVVAVLAFVLTSKSAPATYVVRTNVGVAAFTHPVLDQLEVIKVDKASVVDGAITGTTVLDAKNKAIAAFKLNDPTTTTSYPIPQHQQLTSFYFSPIPKPLGTQLGADQRIMSIHAVAPAAVAGQLRSGDHVDVVAVSTDAKTSKVVESNVVIVSVGTADTGVQAPATVSPTTSSAGAGSTGTASILPTVYVVLVKGTQAAELANYDANYTLYLAYRGAGGTDLPTTPFTAVTLGQ